MIRQSSASSFMLFISTEDPFFAPASRKRLRTKTSNKEVQNHWKHPREVTFTENDLVLYRMQLLVHVLLPTIFLETDKNSVIFELNIYD
ncbi:hypothetical protein ACOMHN_046007 [Nucella lapillus]